MGAAVESCVKAAESNPLDEWQECGTGGKGDLVTSQHRGLRKRDKRMKMPNGRHRGEEDAYGWTL